MRSLPTVTSTGAGTNHRTPGHLHLLLRAAALMATAGLAISCSHHTAGTAIPARTSASTTAPGRHPHVRAGRSADLYRDLR